jgi:hypothetical protein
MTADPTTYAGLQTSLANWLNRDDLTTTEIPEAIAFAEREFQRSVFCPEREVTTTLTATTNTVALPADFWGVKTIYVDAATDTVLNRLTSPELHAKYPTTGTDTPLDYAIEGENLILGPTPSASTSIKLTYFQTIPALSNSQTTNWLLTDHPDLYLDGSMWRLSLLLRDWDGANGFKQSMGAGIESVNRSGRRRTTNSGPLCASTGATSVRNIQA